MEIKGAVNHLMARYIHKSDLCTSRGLWVLVTFMPDSLVEHLSTKITCHNPHPNSSTFTWMLTTLELINKWVIEVIKWVIPYSTKFSQIFNFANFQPFTKIFQQKYLTCGVQCPRAANLQYYFNEFVKNRENLDPHKFSTVR